MAGPIDNRPVSERYSQARLEQLLADADINAAPGWDRDFTTDLQNLYRQQGMNMLLSTLQQYHLERIARQTTTERMHRGRQF